MYQTIISAQTLTTQLKDSHYVIFDCRFDISKPESGYQAYKQNHIPHAQYLNLNEDLSSPQTDTSGRHPLPNPTTLCEKLADYGLHNDSQVIVYDQSNGAIAGRAWWLLRWLGHENVAVLDGGFAQWQTLGLEVSKQIESPRKGDFVGYPDDGMWVSTEYIEGFYNDSAVKIIDARDKKRFSGESEPLDTVGGHIPNAINSPFVENVDKQGCFLPAQQLRKRFESLQDNDIIHSCGSGVTACHNMLAMEIAGLKGSKLYVGSWSEWIRSQQRPIAKGE